VGGVGGGSDERRSRPFKPHPGDQLHEGAEQAGADHARRQQVSGLPAKLEQQPPEDGQREPEQLHETTGQEAADHPRPDGRPFQFFTERRPTGSKPVEVGREYRPRSVALRLQLIELPIDVGDLVEQATAPPVLPQYRTALEVMLDEQLEGALPPPAAYPGFLFPVQGPEFLEPMPATRVGGLTGDQVDLLANFVFAGAGA
jgi:hypothetical protein